MFFSWESAVKYLSKFGVNATYLLDACDQSSFLRLFVPRMFTKLNMNGNNRKIGLGKKETFKV